MNRMSPEPYVIGDQRDGVGESPVWSAKTGLWSVDITGKAIRCRETGGATESWPTHDLPTAIALGSDEMPGLVAFARGVATWAPEAGTGQLLYSPEENPEMRLNEGKCDPKGRFWVASMLNNLTSDLRPRALGDPMGRLFRTGPEGALAVTEREFAIPNTMAWSPDGTRFYAGDSIRNAIWVWDHDAEAGTISNRRVHVAGGPGLPDGSAIDADGCLWTARFGASCLVRTTPAGKTDLVIDLPVSNPTACTFGGSDGRTLFVTSARFGLEAPKPIDGAALMLNNMAVGLPEHRYKGDA
jgi:sugar lactone lactonase YvrE